LELCRSPPRLGFPQAKVFGILCIYAQAVNVKEFRNNQVHRVNRRLVYGTQGQLTETLCDYADASTVNTSFMEHSLEPDDSQSLCVSEPRACGPYALCRAPRR